MKKPYLIILFTAIILSLLIMGASLIDYKENSKVKCIYNQELVAIDEIKGFILPKNANDTILLAHNHKKDTYAMVNKALLGSEFHFYDMTLTVNDSITYYKVLLL